MAELGEEEQVSGDKMPEGPLTTEGRCRAGAGEAAKGGEGTTKTFSLSGKVEVVAASLTMTEVVSAVALLLLLLLVLLPLVISFPVTEGDLVVEMTVVALA